MKKIGLLISILLIFAVTLTGCGASKGDNKSTTNAANDTDLLSKIKKDGVIRIGTEGTYSPFTFHDKNGKLTGFDVEIAEEVAKRLGVKAGFVETKWDGTFLKISNKWFNSDVSK